MAKHYAARWMPVTSKIWFWRLSRYPWSRSASPTIWRQIQWDSGRSWAIKRQRFGKTKVSLDAHHFNRDYGSNSPSRRCLFNTGQRKSSDIPTAMQNAAHTVPATCRNDWTWKRAQSCHHTQRPLVLSGFVNPRCTMEKQRLVDANRCRARNIRDFQTKEQFWNSYYVSNAVLKSDVIKPLAEELTQAIRVTGAWNPITGFVMSPLMKITSKLKPAINRKSWLCCEVLLSNYQKNITEKLSGRHREFRRLCFTLESMLKEVKFLWESRGL